MNKLKAIPRHNSTIRECGLNSLNEHSIPVTSDDRSAASIGSRLVSIDALRGIAALGVVLYHAVHQTGSAVPDNLFRYPVKLIQFLSSFGYIGVFLFFVISGFCIHLQWAKTRAAGETPRINFGSFWKRRIRRLYPPYVITLAGFLVMMASRRHRVNTLLCLRHRDARADAAQSRSPDLLQH